MKKCVPFRMTANFVSSLRCKTDWRDSHENVRMTMNRRDGKSHQKSVTHSIAQRKVCLAEALLLYKREPAHYRHGLRLSVCAIGHELWCHGKPAEFPWLNFVWIAAIAKTFYTGIHSP